MRLLIPALCLALFADRGTFAQSAEELVRVDLVASVQAIEPGKPFDIAVRYRIAPEWHLYWINPGDSGIPPRVTWKLPEGFKAEEPRFPAPRKFKSEGDIWNFGYAEELVLLVKVTPPTTISGSSQLELDTSYLVCKEACLPGKAKGQIELHTGKADKNDPESFAIWYARIPVETRARTVVGVQQSDGLIEKVAVTFDVSLPRDTKDPEFFPGPSDTVAIRDIKVDDSGEIQLNVVPLNKVARLDETVMGVLAYTDSSGTRRALELKARLDVDAGR